MNKRDKKRLFKEYKTIRSILYSRFFLIVILLLLQMGFFILMALRLEPYAEVIYGSSFAVAVLFLIYLVNCKGKNEFKIVWMLPVLIIPVFGIGFYFFFKNIN